MNPIIHIISESDWRAAQAAGVWGPPSLEREGFIHCSRPEQVVATANRHFPGRTDLLLLVIDPAEVQCEIRDEDTTGRGETYPHLYGPLNLDAVVDLRPLTLPSQGGFALPEGLGCSTLSYAVVPVDSTPWWSGRVLNRVPPPILVLAGAFGVLFALPIPFICVANATLREEQSAALVGLSAIILACVCLLSALARSRGFVRVLAGMFLLPAAFTMLFLMAQLVNGHL